MWRESALSRDALPRDLLLGRRAPEAAAVQARDPDQQCVAVALHREIGAIARRKSRCNRQFGPCSPVDRGRETEDATWRAATTKRRDMTAAAVAADSTSSLVPNGSTVVLDHVIPPIVLHAAVDVVFPSLCVPAISIRLPRLAMRCGRGTPHPPSCNPAGAHLVQSVPSDEVRAMPSVSPDVAPRTSCVRRSNLTAVSASRSALNSGELPLRWPIWSASACCAFRSHGHDGIDSSTWAMCDARQRAVNVIGISVMPSTKSLFSRRTGPAGCGLPRRSTTCCIVARI